MKNINNYIDFIKESKDENHLDLIDFQNFFSDLIDEFSYLDFEVKQDEFSTIGVYPSVFRVESDWNDEDLIDDKIDLRPGTKFSNIIDVIKNRLLDYVVYSQGHAHVWKMETVVESSYLHASDQEKRKKNGNGKVKRVVITIYLSTINNNDE